MSISRYIIIGFMGAGKTYYAQKMNYILHLPFWDLDQEIVKREGKSITEIFSKRGEQYFREIESTCLYSAINKHDIIISTGGGIIELEYNRKLIKESHSEVIFLNPAWNIIWERIKNSTRPIIQNNSHDIIYKLWLKRYPLYAECASIHLDSLEIINQSLYDISNTKNLSLFLNLKDHK